MHQNTSGLLNKDCVQTGLVLAMVPSPVVPWVKNNSYAT